MKRSPWFWLATAILAERIAMRETKGEFPRERVLEVLARQTPASVLEAVTGSTIHMLADGLDADAKVGAVVDLAQRRSLRRAGEETNFAEISRRAATIAKAHGRAPTDADMLAARKDLE